MTINENAYYQVRGMGVYGTSISAAGRDRQRSGKLLFLTPVLLNMLENT